MTDSPDYAGAYRDLRTRVSDLVRSSDPADLEKAAPATPDWRVRDVVAHMAGICDDISNGNMEGVGSDEWTNAHVAKRADWTIDQLLDDWDEHAQKVEAIMNDLGSPMGQMLVDASTHEQDIRGALGAPAVRDSTAMAIGVDWALEAFGARLLAEDNAGTLRIEHEGGSAVLGSGEPVTMLRASRFELGRTMTGRRSRAQVDALDWDGPFDRSWIMGGPPVFTPPTVDLIE